jgi:hypothetical protein
MTDLVSILHDFLFLKLKFLLEDFDDNVGAVLANNNLMEISFSALMKGI